MSCRRFWISGKVQGVFFRESTRREAERLGLTGYARNLPDGRVEVLACGPDDKLAALAHWLANGPPWARVEKVVPEPAADAAPPGFTIA